MLNEVKLNGMNIVVVASIQLTVTETEARDQVVLVERSQRLADDADGRLVWIRRVA